MECNKDEAIRAKEIAERKFMSKDAVGALRFALKSQKLYPQLDGVEQLISSLNVHVAAADKASGECDWYKMLDVDPKADNETIRRQFMKVAHSLRPEKDWYKLLGIDPEADDETQRRQYMKLPLEVFKLVSQCWSLLADKAEWTAYEPKRNISTSQEVPNPGARTDQNNGCAGQESHNEKPDTFWTHCRGCKTDFEFQRFCVDRLIRCPMCRHIFRAKEEDPPTSNGFARQGSQNEKPETIFTYCCRCETVYDYQRFYPNQVVKCPNCLIFHAKEKDPPTSDVQRHRNHSGSSQAANQTNGGLSSGGASSSSSCSSAAAANVSRRGHKKVKRLFGGKVRIAQLRRERELLLMARRKSRSPREMRLGHLKELLHVVANAEEVILDDGVDI